MKKKDLEQIKRLQTIKGRLQAELEFQRLTTMTPEQRIKEQIKKVDEQISNLT